MEDCQCDKQNKQNVLREEGNWMGPEQRKHFCGEDSTWQCCWHFHREEEGPRAFAQGLERSSRNTKQWLVVHEESPAGKIKKSMLEN